MTRAEIDAELEKDVKMTPLTLDLEKSLYRAYREGWGDGATFMGMTRPEDARHAQEYDSGYADGYRSRKNALSQRATLLSYDPLVRLAAHKGTIPQ